MRAISLFDWSLSLAVQPDEAFVTVKAGQEAETYNIPKHILVQKSGFFAKALNNSEFSETTTRMVSLPEADERAFQLWLDWAYTGKLSSTALDVQVIEEADNPREAKNNRARIVTAAWWRFLVEAVAYPVVADICTSFESQNAGFFSEKALGEEWERKLDLLKQLHKMSESTRDGNTRSRNHLEHFYRELDVYEKAYPDLDKRPTGELKASFERICRQKILAASGYPSLKSNFNLSDLTFSVRHENVSDELRPGYVNLIRLYKLSDFLISEQCKNMIIDAIAELCASSRYIPNAVDVGELWGYEGEIADIEELRLPDRKRNLKGLIRAIYCSKKTAKLILEEEDSYPEMFLREIQVVARELSEEDKQAWKISKTRCTQFHFHLDTPPCFFS